MALNGISEKQLSASYMKVAHLHMAVESQLDIECFRRILQKEGDINYEEPIRSDDVNLNLLHSAYRYNLFDIFELLVNYGADFSVKNCEGRTVIHRVLYESYNDYKSSSKFENTFVDSILSAHVKFRNLSNPRCKYGITHFYAACMANHVEAVEFYLENGVSVDEAVNENSPIFAGFTPLHFAVRFLCFEVVDILLKHGAKMDMKNAARMTAMHLLIERKINESRLTMDQSNKKMIEFLLKHDVDDFGLSKLHVACLLDDTSVVENILANQSLDVNQAINMDSPICAGYTPLHFAATANMNTVKLLLKNEADIKAKDAQNVTPFDLCLQNHELDDIHWIISSQFEWENIKLSDGRTRLLDLVYAMKSSDDLNKFLEQIDLFADLTVPADSSLWPGYTILHLAVIFSENEQDETYYFEGSKDIRKVKDCLDRGDDITKKDVKGLTALHLAFYSRKVWTVRTLLKHYLTVDNPSDNNNLSHFHIACAAQDRIAVERFLAYDCVDVNVPINATIKWRVFSSQVETRQLFLTPGSTALHISVACGNVEIAKNLLDNGADIYAKDCNGLTPIHRLISSGVVYFDDGIDDLLLNIDGLQDSIAHCGLGYLHVACHLQKLDAVEKLLDCGADVNAVITCEKNAEVFEDEDYYFDHYGDPSKEPLSILAGYNDCTPLQIALKKCNTDIQFLLIERGANVFTENSMYSNEQFQHKAGLPKLHMACYLRKLDLVEELLLQGEDVNMRYPIKPGNTPLHFAVMETFSEENDVPELIEILLKNGADVALENDNGDTPLHLLEKQYDDNLVDCRSARLLLKSIKDFDNNVVNPQGMSFFHFACLMKDVEMVEKFIENGIDVNRPVGYHVNRYAVCSPLHLVTNHRSKGSDDLDTLFKLVDLLLKNGADVLAIDAYGNTPLHSGNFGTSREKIFDIFIRNGLDVNAENILGETALETLIKSANAQWKEVECLLKHGARINSYNPFTQEGYITKIFDYVLEEKNALANEVIRNLITSEYVLEIDSAGRSFIHNFVSIRNFEVEDDVELIGQLVKRSFEINHQDREGRTALHTATWFRNSHGVLALMKNGADINITDKHGKTAFAYGFESPHKSCSYENHSDPNHVINAFAMHVHKMETCGLHVSDVNQRFQADALEMYYLKEDVLKRFREQMKKTKSIKMGSGKLTLYEFGFAMDAEMLYPSMLHFMRQEIDEFFENIRQHQLDELDYLLKAKYDKACERLRLFNLAVEPFSSIIKSQIPELCCRIILSYLSATDLKNVIATEDL